jgi:hypothetical protein
VKRTLVAVALVIVFVMALAAPAFAQSITHSATYQMDGVINFKKQMGHLCNTGAEIKQTIMGSGQMDKVQTVTMIKGKITMKDTNDGVAGATPLTVTTVWELCAPPKYMYDDGDNESPVGLTSIFATQSAPGQWNLTPTGMVLAGMDTDEWADLYPAYEALTDQIWAVQVAADPGYSINVHQDGVAAHGPYWATGTAAPFAYDASWKQTLVNKNNTWRWELNEDGNVAAPSVGANYVGSFFNMAQHARTSMGTLKRYIDISSPFSHGYLHEDMSVVGKSDVKEAFGMGNLPAGADVPGDWWKLF